MAEKKTFKIEDVLSVSTGRLRFFGWAQPTWDLLQEDGTAVDIKAPFWAFLLANAGQRATLQYVGRHFPSIKLELDPNSDRELLAEKIDCGALVSDVNGRGFTNLASYAEQTLTVLAGRLVKIRIDPDCIWLEADRSEEVFGVKYFGEGNSARVPEGAERTTCGVGTGKECCIFLAAGAGGFSCEKFSGHMARHLMARTAEGKMNAGRLGSCAVIGREERPGDEEDKANG